MIGISLKKSTIFQNIPCTLVTGFLGAGKTTIINQLLASRPSDERWALLINEFGRIGIDGALLMSTKDSAADKSDIAIREVSGGCICCTSQLPLQIAISRLLSDHHPQRLLIEPTGLAHPRELVQQLAAPHWQTALKMQAVITVLSGIQWQQKKYRTHDGFQAHVREADVLVVNRYAQLNDVETHELQEWIRKLNAQVSIIWATPIPTTADMTDTTAEAYLTALSKQLTKPSQLLSKQRKVAIAHPQQSMVNLQPRTASVSAATITSPLSDPSSTALTNDTDDHNSSNSNQPYRYHEQQQDVLLAGWRLPSHYVLQADNLQNWLLALPNWQRIKGIVHTDDGWLQVNFTPDSLTTSTVSAQTDSRLEIILHLDDDAGDIDNRHNENNGDDVAVDDNNIIVKDKAGQNMTNITSTSEQSTIDWEAYDRELMALVIQLAE